MEIKIVRGRKLSRILDSGIEFQLSTKKLDEIIGIIDDALPEPPEEISEGNDIVVFDINGNKLSENDLLQFADLTKKLLYASILKSSKKMSNEAYLSGWILFFQEMINKTRFMCYESINPIYRYAVGAEGRGSVISNWSASRNIIHDEIFNSVGIFRPVFEENDNGGFGNNILINSLDIMLRNDSYLQQIKYIVDMINNNTKREWFLYKNKKYIFPLITEDEVEKLIDINACTKIEFSEHSENTININISNILSEYIQCIQTEDLPKNSILMVELGKEDHGLIVLPRGEVIHHQLIKIFTRFGRNGMPARAKRIISFMSNKLRTMSLNPENSFILEK